MNRFSGLSPARMFCVRACQELNFGQIIALGVLDREPVFGGDTRMRIDVKLNGDDGPRPELTLDDFELPSEWVRFFSKLDAIRDGLIDEVEVRSGIPRRMVLTKAY